MPDWGTYRVVVDPWYPWAVFDLGLLLHRAPKVHISLRILQTIISGMTLISGLRTRT